MGRGLGAGPGFVHAFIVRMAFCLPELASALGLEVQAFQDLGGEVGGLGLLSAIGKVLVVQNCQAFALEVLDLLPSDGY